MKGKERVITVRIPEELYKVASLISSVTGSSLRELIVEGLKKEINDRINRDPGLSQAVSAVYTYRREKV